VGGLGLVAAPAFAHHSTSMYDMENPVTITGTVKRFEWTNPHAYIIMTVRDEVGKKDVEWAVEMMSLNHLKSYGWMHTTVKPGDVITCTGGPARSGQTTMIASLIKLPDGRVIKS
jgi:DNA/RNA endonuclease YhcR with UshA esterase domain